MKVSTWDHTDKSVWMKEAGGFTKDDAICVIHQFILFLWRNINREINVCGKCCICLNPSSSNSKYQIINS